MKNWILVYDGYTKAVGHIFSALSEYVTPICMNINEINDSHKRDYNLIYVGNNPYIKAPNDGYRIKVFDTEFETQSIIIAGDGETYTLYAAMDFVNDYLVKAKEQDVHQAVYHFKKLFTDPFPAYDESFVPSIKDRGLWTWGYVIYDYKRYIDNMVKLKLNMLIIWNDCVPINAVELVKYAHENGVRIIWGFEWGWGVDCLQADVVHLEKITERVLRTYQKDYAHLGADGLYFQTFTETDAESIGSISIAEAALQLVNGTAEKLLALDPNLHIQFGLHTNSVKSKLEVMQRVNSKVSIIWENCGSFPFTNMAKDIDGFEETVTFTKKVKNLRDGGFGVVLKGLIGLDWSRFSHQPGPFVLGTYDRNFVKNRTGEKKDFWKYIQAYWIRNAKYAYEIIQLFDYNTIATALVEDGCFEEKIYYPVALYAAMLWNTNKSLEDILCETALRSDVEFV